VWSYRRIVVFTEKNPHDLRTRTATDNLLLHFVQEKKSVAKLSLIQVEINMSDFNPHKSSVRAETVVDFLQKNIQQLELKDIPGVGNSMRDDLISTGICTPVQLLGKFLLLHSCDGNTCDSFFNFIKSINSRANAHNIVFSIASYADNKGILKYEY